MTDLPRTPVLIVGGGPVGLCLALDLAARGIAVTVAETREAGEPPSVKCNHVSSRTMETLRRLGIAAEARAAGLPDDYPNDIVFRTSVGGFELTRIPIPCRAERFTASDGPDCGWPTPEPPHRVNQMYFEPILFHHAAARAGITLLNRTRIERFEQSEHGVTAIAHDLDGDRRHTIHADYLVGCDGGQSGVRKAIGAALVGDAVIQRVQSSYFRAPDLLARIRKPDAWMTYLYNPARAGNLIAIDGKELWLLHNYLLPNEGEFDAVDRDACIRLLLGVGPEFDYELLANEDWIGRRLIADRFRDRRVFICGDAAHLWVPYAGYGMNAGIADAMNLSWQLAARLHGWGGEAILDGYVRERQPITDQVSRFAMAHAQGAIAERNNIPEAIAEDSPRSAALRAKIGEEVYARNVRQFACAGLNYGYYYDDSPLIAYDDEPAPGYTMYDYHPSTVPGCRVPHFWLADGTSLYDAMGDDFTLLRFDQRVDVAPLLAAAAAAGVPVSLLDILGPTPPAPYRHALLLGRPDRHVAWRGDALPERPEALIDRVAGRAG